MIKETYKIKKWYVISGEGGTAPTATVEIENCTKTTTQTATDHDPVTAMLKAINRQIDVSDIILNGWYFRGEHDGEIPYMGIDMNLNIGGKSFMGRSTYPDFYGAVGEAYINAINKYKNQLVEIVD